MPHAANHVKWCISKAERELEECKNSGKRLKHRGLREIKPDTKKAQQHIAKAEHNMNAIMIFKKNGYSDWSITAGFYALYHCFLAIAANFGYESRNQVCTIALIEHLNEQKKINIHPRFIKLLADDIEEHQENSVIEMREECTYGIEISAADEKLDKLVKDCAELIEITKGIIY